MWEGVLFHLALLLCARQVVKRGSEQARESAIEGEREMEKGKIKNRPNGQRHCLAVLRLSVRHTGPI